MNISFAITLSRSLEEVHINAVKFSLYLYLCETSCDSSQHYMEPVASHDNAIVHIYQEGY